MRIDRRRFLKTSGALLLGGAATATGGYLYGTRLETEWLEVVRTIIPVDAGSGLEGMRLIILSDFHLYPHTRIEFIEEVVEQAQRLDPDLVVLLGDYVQATAESIFDLAPVLARLDPALGLFSVIGNHDIWTDIQTVRQGLQREGIPILENQGIELRQNGRSFYLAGVDDAWSGRPDLEAALAGIRSSLPVLLLSHEPDPADAYCLDERVTVQLSGHSHGGQVRLPGYGSPFLPPYGKKYGEGLYRVNGSWLYTNRGIGVTVPIRLNCRPELTEITFAAVPQPAPAIG